MIPLSLPLFGLNRPTSFSLFSQETCSSALNILLAFSWTIFMALFQQGDQNWTWSFACGLTSAIKRGRIPSLSLLGPLFPTQCRRLLTFLITSTDCWLMVSLCTRKTRPFSGNLSSLLAPSLVCCLPMCWAWCLCLMNLSKLLSVHFFSPLWAL